MPRKKQTKRTKKGKSKQSNDNERAQQSETSDAENVQNSPSKSPKSKRPQSSQPDLAGKGSSGSSNFPRESIAGPSRSHQNTESSSASVESLKGKLPPGEPFSSSEPLSSTYYATGPSTSSSVASISFPQVYHFLGPSTSSSSAASPLRRRRIFYLGGSSTPSVSFSPDIGQSSLEDLVAAAEIELARLRQEEAARLQAEGSSSSEDFHKRMGRRIRRHTY